MSRPPLACRARFPAAADSQPVYESSSAGSMHTVMCQLHATATVQEVRARLSRAPSPCLYNALIRRMTDTKHSKLVRRQDVYTRETS